MSLSNRLKKLEEISVINKDKIKFITLHPGEVFNEKNYPGIDKYEVIIIDDISESLQNRHHLPNYRACSQ